MGKDNKEKSSEEIYAAPVANIVKLTTGINRIAKGAPDVNSYAMRNAIILAKKKWEVLEKNDRLLPPTAMALHAQAQHAIGSAAKQKRTVLYKKGYTVAGVNVPALEAEAENDDLDHSKKLGRNIKVANPKTVRPDETDAHHIVARNDWRAEESREYIFGVGIGINDADNGTIMPRYLTTLILSLPNASKHQEIHTAKYHARVFASLLDATDYTQAAVRVVLKSIGSQLIAGIFPFKKVNTMNIWKFECINNDYTSFVYLNKQDVKEKIFLTDGTPKHWPVAPRLQPYLEKNKKKQQPLADISYISPGSAVLNLKAYQALRDFLSPFGQLLEVEYVNAGNLLDDEAKVSDIYYFYNVTNIIPCIDYDNSEKLGSGVNKEVFFADAIPQDVQVFKDPWRRRTQIYLSNPAKIILEKLIVDAQLTGAEIVAI